MSKKPRQEDTNVKWAKDPEEKPYMMEGRMGHLPTKKCCGECPLRRVHPSGWLGGYTPEEYLFILSSDADIACHLSPGFKTRNLADQRSCTGVAVYRKNIGKLPTGHAEEAVRSVHADREAYFAMPGEFLEHHSKRPK